MAVVLGNRAKMSTSTTGTGTITLGSALSGYQTFAQAGITNGQTVRYAIEDGTNFEIGSGVYTSSGTTLTRSVTESSNSDSAISLSGSAEVFITASAADIFVNDGATSLTTTGVITGGTVEATSDTAAGDNAAMGYTSAEGLILTGQGSTNDITIKNDADTAVISIPTGGTNVDFVGSIDVANVGISTGVIDLKNSGSQSVVKFYCESSNAHYAEIKAPAHGAFSGNVTLTLPATTDTIAGIAATQTFTNKTLTSPVLNTGSVGTSLAFPDNAKALFGAGSDLEIFHNGSDSFVKDNGDGILFLQGSNAVKIIGNTASAAILDANEGGGVHLYHNGSEKIASTANGISVTGNVIATGTVEPAGDTAAGDNAAIGYTAAEGLILTGQGSTSDITLKNDADATVFTVPTGTDDILFPDNAKAMFGAGSDLLIYHDGSNSYINEVGTGQLLLAGQDVRITTPHAGEFMATFGVDGAVTLYHDNAAKIATTATGVEVTGNVIATGTVEPAGDTAAGDNAAIGYTAAEGLILTGQGSTSDITLKNDADAVVFTVPTGTDDILFPDNAKAMFGAGSDLQIYHDGSHSIIKDGGTGNLQLNAGNFVVNNVADSANIITGNDGGAVSLFYNGGKKVETTATGAAITGAVKPTTYQETYVAKSAASTVTCDLATGTSFSVTLDQNTTFAFTNPPSSGTAFSFTLFITQHSTAVTLTWPGTVDWAGGSAPDAAAANEVQAYGFFTRDGGTTYYGFLGGSALG